MRSLFDTKILQSFSKIQKLRIQITFFNYSQHRTVRTLFLLKDTVLIIKSNFHFDSSTLAQLLRHIRFCEVALIFELTVVHHKYRDTGYMYQSGCMSGITLQTLMCKNV